LDYLTTHTSLSPISVGLRLAL